MTKNPLKNIQIKEEIDYDKLRKSFIRNLDDRPYFKFCEENGFEPTNIKTVNQLKKEQKVYLELLKKQKEMGWQISLQERKIKDKENKNPNHFDLKKIMIEKSSTPFLSDEEKETIHDIFTLLSKYWSKINKNPVLLTMAGNPDTYIVDVIKFIAHYKKHWIRNLEDFKPKGHNASRVVLKLFHFLFVKHSIPKGMYYLFSYLPQIGIDESEKYWKYLLDVSTGGSPKNVPTKGVCLPKKQTHNFMLNLKKYPWFEAIRRTQFNWLKIDKKVQDDLWRVADIRSESIAVSENRKLDFFVFYGRQSMLDGHLLQPLWDYYQFKTRENPNYKLKGRNVFNLIDEMNIWHRELTQGQNPKKNFSWERSGLREYAEGRKFEGLDMQIYVKELYTSAELFKEGKRQHHCVSSYATSCSRGSCSIWSLREDFIDSKDIGYTVLATIEVRGKSVVQAKAKRNEKISTKARAIMERWANLNSLEINI